MANYLFKKSYLFHALDTFRGREAQMAEIPSGGRFCDKGGSVEAPELRSLRVFCLAALFAGIYITHQFKPGQLNGRVEKRWKSLRKYHADWQASKEGVYFFCFKVRRDYTKE